jgi:hypothetical protein
MCPDNLTARLSQGEIESAVRRFWELFASKRTDLWQSYYADVALVFGTASKRPEPARLVVMRRQREYLEGATKMDIKVAAYLLQLHAEHVSKPTAAGQ